MSYDLKINRNELKGTISFKDANVSIKRYGMGLIGGTKFYLFNNLLEFYLGMAVVSSFIKINSYDSINVKWKSKNKNFPLETNSIMKVYLTPLVGFKIGFDFMRRKNNIKSN